MKQIFLLLFLSFSVISGFSQTKRKVSKKIHWVDTPHPVPVDTTIEIKRIYPEFDNEKNWKELIEKNRMRYYYHLITRFP